MRIFFGFIVMLSVLGCSNDFDIVDQKKETPVVYGVLDLSEEFQYIKIERVFQAIGIDANEVARLTDSLYYKDLVVTLTNNRNAMQTTLQEVNGEDEGLPRDTGGVFAQTPNILYKGSLESIEAEVGDNVMLSIEGIFEDRAVTASTNLIARPGISSPANDTQESFLLDKSKAIRWSKREGNELYSARFIIDVIEVRNEVPQVKTVEWVLATSTKETEVILAGIEFYQFMGGAFAVEPNTTRFVDEIRFELTAGNLELATLGDIASANLGITASSEVPTYSNLSEGLGIFASKNKFTAINISLDGDSRQLLKESPFTVDLNF